MKRRPTNPRGVAKAATRGGAAAAEKKPHEKRARTAADPAALPASVTIAIVRVVRGETITTGAGVAQKAWGVFYRPIVRDARSRPIAIGAIPIRRHLLRAATGSATTNEAVRIDVVAPDPAAGGLLFFGLEENEAAERIEREERYVEYFSYELGGMSFAILQSGYTLTRTVRTKRCELVRAPHAVNSVHGAVEAGLMEPGGVDRYVLER